MVLRAKLQCFVVGGHTGGDEELRAEFGDAGVEVGVAGGFKGWEGAWWGIPRLAICSICSVAQLKLQASSSRGGMAGEWGIPGDAAENEP